MKNENKYSDLILFIDSLLTNRVMYYKIIKNYERRISGFRYAEKLLLFYFE